MSSDLMSDISCVTPRGAASRSGRQALQIRPSTLSAVVISHQGLIAVRAVGAVGAADAVGAVGATEPRADARTQRHDGGLLPRQVRKASYAIA
jgi:hypothetical protein